MITSNPFDVTITFFKTWWRFKKIQLWQSFKQKSGRDVMVCAFRGKFTFGRRLDFANLMK